MLFYNFNTLDDFIKNNLTNALQSEKENLKKISNLYVDKKTNLLSITNNMIEIADNMDENLEEFHEIISALKKAFENIDIIEALTAKLEENLNINISLYDKGLEYNINEIKANLVEYNKQRDDLFNKILELESSNTSILNSAIELSFLSNKKKIKKQTIHENIDKTDALTIDIQKEPHDNNTLIVSEKSQKAYLPFFYSNVKDMYEADDSKFLTMQEVINNVYVVPLSRFKNSSISRFRESFNLIRNKEKGSITKALDLGLELMFKYELNPIIIAACRNLDELDIYLSCMEDDEVHEFPCFEVKFEIMPQISKKKNTF